MKRSQDQVDPRFVRLKKKQQKTVLDPRFKDMLDGGDFQDFKQSQQDVSVDMYGRRLGSQRVGKNQLTSKKRKNVLGKLFTVEKTASEAFDPARGVGAQESSSEEDVKEDIQVAISSEDEHEVVPISKAAKDDPEAQYIEEMQILDQDPNQIPTMDNPTKRLALVNIDWDTLNSRDIMRILNGFKPKGGSIMSVAIYTSDFGKTRLQQEQLHGPPKEIFAHVREIDDDDASQVDDELVQQSAETAFDTVALRKYQLERLRYYYAVIILDDSNTARQIYKQCDQLEFEYSTLKLDLRYIPDDVEFGEVDIRDQCSSADFATQDAAEKSSVINELKQKMNQVNSLGYSSQRCSWDEDLPDRKIMRRKWSKDELKQMDFDAYLASDIDESSEDEKVLSGSDTETAADNKENMREKYRSLLDAQSDGDKSDGSMEQEMEISFAPGLSNLAQELLEAKRSRENQQGETVFERYLREKKEKQKSLKVSRKEVNETVDQDDIPQEFKDDPFFKDAYGPEFDIPAGKASITRPTTKSKNDVDQNSRERAELELLLLDQNKQEDSDEDYSKPKKNRNLKKQIKNQNNVPVEEFELDTTDARFGALFDSPEYAIDPTDSKFKKTKGMSNIINQRQKMLQINSDVPERTAKAGNVTKDESLSGLVKKIKSKTRKQI